MAVYTHLDRAQLADLIAAYDVGTLVSAKGIAEGVSNSNWLIETTGHRGAGARYVLTMYERRIDTGDLPFFLGLLNHLSEKGCPVPGTIRDTAGAAFRLIGDKAVALIEFMPGLWPDPPTPAQADAAGRALAGIHLAARDFPMSRANTLTPADSARTLTQCGSARLASIDSALPAAIARARGLLAAWPDDLPRSVIHADLFPDNVLMIGDRVSGLIDFYFACTDMMAYDLAVTHAAWSFSRDGRFLPEIGRTLIAGYRAVREPEEREVAALPILAQGACLRFVASRAEDWLDTPTGAAVARKDPMEFVRRWDFYEERGGEAFASA